jgi:hypothetical protein
MTGTAHVDLDFVKWGAASIGEKRSVVVTHIPSGKTKEFSTKSEFYGRDRKHTGGWLAELNKSRAVPFDINDFKIEDKQTIKEPLVNVLHTAKLMVDSAIKKSGAKKHKCYIGKGQSFRVEVSTLLEYKGNRKEMPIPLLMEEVTEYLINKYRPEIVTHHEVDDRVVMETWNKPDHFIIGIDKDYLGAGTRFFNVNKPDLGVIDCTGLGELTNTKDGISGRGRLFKYWQVISHDTSDNYKANCFSKTRWGQKKAYDALVYCDTDKAALQALVDVFKFLYPEPQIIKGWRGNEIEIDWLYVMHEMMNLVHLHRKQDDFIDTRELLNKLGVHYEVT